MAATTFIRVFLMEFAVRMCCPHVTQEVNWKTRDKNGGGRCAGWRLSVVCLRRLLRACDECKDEEKVAGLWRIARASVTVANGSETANFVRLPVCDPAREMT